MLLTMNYLFLLSTFRYGALCFDIEEGYCGRMYEHVTRLHSLPPFRAPHEVGGKGEGGRPAAKDRRKRAMVGGTGGGQVVDQSVQQAGGLAAGWGGWEFGAP